MNANNPHFITLDYEAYSPGQEIFPLLEMVFEDVRDAALREEEDTIPALASVIQPVDCHVSEDAQAVLSLRPHSLTEAA